jgi:hypothetical protein
MQFFFNLYIKNIIFDDAYKAEIKEKKEIKYEEKYLDLFLHLRSFKTPPSSEAMAVMSDEDSAQLKADCAFSMRKGVKNNDVQISSVQDPDQISPVSEQRLEQLMNCTLFEMTPVGNVIMRYNAKKEAFEYYSDCTIPYRFLDTVCRKYAVTFYCKSLYVVMNDEVKESEAKTKLLQEEKTKERENGEDTKKNKGVFAKFKTYNKEMGAGRIGTGKKPTEENAPIVVKQRINKFLYLGKTANFITGKKEVAEKPKLSFMDFKKMMFKK